MCPWDNHEQKILHNPDENIDMEKNCGENVFVYRCVFKYDANTGAELVQLVR